MAIDLSLLGKRSAPIPFRYEWKDVVLYALSVGCKAEDLDFLYEARGPKVLPTFAVVPSFAPMVAVVADLKCNPMAILHGEQQIVLHRPIPTSATLHTTSEVKAIYDKGKGALVVVQTQTVDEKGEPVFDNVFSLFVRGEGGFGGERGPEADKSEPPARAPDFEVSEKTSTEQALFYRLNGDLNPLHADPAMAKFAGFERPILHGLCSFGFAGRAILYGACAGDAARLRSFGARFSGVVLPGQTLTTRGWKLDSKRYTVTVSNDVGQKVLSNGMVEVF